MHQPYWSPISAVPTHAGERRRREDRELVAEPACSGLTGTAVVGFDQAGYRGLKVLGRAGLFDFG